MLKEILALLRKGDLINLSIGCESLAGSDPVAQPARFRVIVTPKLFTLDGEKGADRKALNTPLMVEGTAEELDSPEFAATISRFSASTTALRHTIDEVETTHKQAAEKKKAEPAKKSSGGTLPPHKPKTPAKPAPKPAATKASWKDRVKPKAGTAKPATAAELTAETPAETPAAEATPETPEPPKNAAEATPALI